MQMLLEVRETIINIAKRFEGAFLFIFKFIFGMIIYSQILSIGYNAEVFDFIVSSGITTFYLLFMALLFVILPLNASYLFMILNIIIQISSRVEIALLTFLGLIFMFLFYSSFSRKENILIVLSIFAFNIGMPYFITIFAALYFGISAIIPISIGLFIWTYSPFIMNLVRGVGVIPADAGILDIGLEEILYAFEALQASIALESYLASNWFIATILFFIVFLFVYICRKLSINYAKEIAIGFGTILNIFVFIAASAMGALDFGIFSVIFGSIFASIIIFVIKFFDVFLDYNRAENVEFQDEDYYYYVKLIPKRKSVHSVMQKRQEKLRDEEEYYRQIEEDEEEEDETPPSPRRKVPVRRGSVGYNK